MSLFLCPKCQEIKDSDDGYNEIAKYKEPICQDCYEELDDEELDVDALAEIRKEY